MDLLTLELFDVTASQAVRELQRALESHGGLAMRISGSEDLVLHNVRRFLERSGRGHRVAQEGARAWRVDVDPPQALPVPAPAPAFRPPPPKPVLLTRSAFLPGDRVLGRRLLLGVLEAVEDRTPWVCLAHEALELLEDPAAVELLERLEARGIRVFVSEASRAYHLLSPPFASLPDGQWQGLAARGELVLI